MTISVKPATTGQSPRRRSRSGRVIKYCALTFVVLVSCAALVGLFLRSHYLRAGEERLAEVTAELDRTDPGWRLTEIFKARGSLPEGENPARHVLAAAKHLKDPIGKKALPVEELGVHLKPGFSLPPFDYSMGTVSDYLERLEPNQRYSAQFAEFLAVELASREPALAEVRILADSEKKGVFEVTLAKDALSTLLPHAEQLRQLSALLECEAGAQAQQGRLDEALKTSRTIIPLGRTMGDDPTLICCLARIAVVAKAIQCIERTLGQGLATEEQLARTQRLLELELKECPASLVMALRGERGMFFHASEGLATGELGMHWLEQVSGGSQMESSWYENALDWTVVRVSARRGQPIGLDLMSRMLEAAKRPPAELLPALDDFEDETKELRTRGMANPSYIVPALLLPAIHKVGYAHLKGRSQLACASASVAAERYRLKHGRWPESLNTLVPEFLDRVPDDHFSGGKVILRRLDDGLLIYAVGQDRVDNGGNVKRSPPKIEGIDIGFRLWNPDKRGLPPPAPPPADLPEREELP